MARRKSESVKKAEKALKEMAEPKYVDKLELGSGEIYVGNMSDADKYQLMVRHINILENHIKLNAQCLSITAICLQELCKKEGIDINKILNK